LATALERAVSGRTAGNATGSICVHIDIYLEIYKERYSDNSYRLAESAGFATALERAVSGRTAAGCLSAAPREEARGGGMAPIVAERSNEGPSPT